MFAEGKFLFVWLNFLLLPSFSFGQKHFDVTNHALNS